MAFTTIPEWLAYRQRSNNDILKHDFTEREISWFYCEPCDRLWHYESSSQRSTALFCRDHLDLEQVHFDNASHKVCPLVGKDCPLLKLGITTAEPISIKNPKSPKTIKYIKKELMRIHGKNIDF